MFGRRACPAVERPVLWSAAIPAGFSPLAACAASSSRAIASRGNSAVDGEGPEVFGLIGGLDVTADGRIVVLHYQAQELRVFAPDGWHLGRAHRDPPAR